MLFFIFLTLFFITENTDIRVFFLWHGKECLASCKKQLKDDVVRTTNCLSPCPGGDAGAILGGLLQVLQHGKCFQWTSKPFCSYEAAVSELSFSWTVSRADLLES